MNLDWTIVGSIAGVAAVAVGVLQLRSSRRGLTGERRIASRTVQYEVAALKGKIPKSVQRNSSYTALTAERFQFFNVSGHDLKEVRLRVAPISRVWSASVTRTLTLSSESVQILINEESVLITLLELPASESFDVTVFSNDFYLSFDRVRSENASVRLVEK